MLAICAAVTAQLCWPDYLGMLAAGLLAPCVNMWTKPGEGGAHWQSSRLTGVCLSTASAILQYEHGLCSQREAERQKKLQWYSNGQRLMHASQQQPVISHKVCLQSMEQSMKQRPYLEHGVVSTRKALLQQHNQLIQGSGGQNEVSARRQVHSQMMQSLHCMLGCKTGHTSFQRICQTPVSPPMSLQFVAKCNCGAPHSKWEAAQCLEQQIYSKRACNPCPPYPARQ